MQKVSNLQGRQWTAVFFLTALGVVIADQLTKLWIRSSLDVGDVLWQAGIFSIVRNQNTGSSFGLFQDHSLALAIVSIIGIVFILVYTLIFYPRFFPSDGLLGKVALGLILGGTIGNLIERICHLIDPARFGGVTDFLSIGWFPAFNVADSAISVGAILFACSLLLLTVARKH
jgi:signal peptidase II